MPLFGHQLQFVCASPTPSTPRRGRWSRAFCPTGLVISLSLILGGPADASRAKEATTSAAASEPTPTKEPSKAATPTTEVDPRSSVVVSRSTKVTPEPTAAAAEPTPTLASDSDAATPENRSGEQRRVGLFGQVLGTIDNFYGSDDSAPAHDPQTGIAESTAATPGRPASISPETKAKREGMASAGNQPAANQPESDAQNADSPRWARGGLIGSYFGKEKTPKVAEGRVVQLPSSQTPRVAKAPQQPTPKAAPESRPPADQAAAQASAEKPGWMSRLNPWSSKKEPAPQQANSRPTQQRSTTSQTAQRRQPNSQSVQRMASNQPAQRQQVAQPAQRMANNQPAQRQTRNQSAQQVTNNQPAVRRAPTAQPVRPVNQSPVAHSQPTQQVRHWPSMEPTVAVQFGHGKPVDPSQPQIAQAAPQAVTPESIAITPIPSEQVAAASPQAATETATSDWSTIDLAEMFPSATPAPSQVAVAPPAKQAPASAGEVAKNDWRPAGKPMVEPQEATTPVADEPTVPTELAAVELASSADKLGLAQLVKPAGPQDAKQPAAAKNDARSPIDVATQPRTVR